MMSTQDAIALAQKIQAMPNEYEIASVLLHLEHEAKLEGVADMAAALRTKEEPVA